MKTAICVSAFLSVVSSGLIYQSRNCAFFGVTPMQNFQKDKYSGLWYMNSLYDYPNSSQYNCYTVLRTPTLDGNADMVEVIFNPNLNTEIRFDGKTTYDIPGQGHYTYSYIPAAETKYLDMTIMSTDHIKYSIEWSCRNIGNDCSVSVLIYSRNPTLDAVLQATVNATLDAHHVDRTRLRSVNNDIVYCARQTLPPTQTPGILRDLLGGLLGGILDAILGLLG